MPRRLKRVKIIIGIIKNKIRNVLEKMEKKRVKKKKGEEVGPPIDTVDVDDVASWFTPISCRGSNKSDPISVEQYSSTRALHLSLISSQKRTLSSILLDDDDDDDPIVLDVDPTPKTKPPSVIEIGECSNSKPDTPPPPPPAPPPFLCEICAEPKPISESFNINGCTHFYCTDCVINYVASKLQDNITCIRCPVSSCHGLLEPDYCRPILPPEVFERWGTALCEAVILASEKFYCPFKDCSALFIRDVGGEVIRESECPNCRRMFCAVCEVAWHAGIDCAEFQKLNKDEREREDIMMLNLAKSKNWKRCPKCKFYVEKSQGCFYMRCRCGFAFCYNCGAPSTSNSHMCSECKH